MEIISIIFTIIKMLIRYMRKMTSIMDSLKPVARIYWEVEEKVTFRQTIVSTQFSDRLNKR